MSADKVTPTPKSAQGSKDWHAKAFRYYCLGLNSKELARVFGVSYRTVQGLMSREDWKQRRAEHLEAEERATVARILSEYGRR